ncbi:MAG: flavin reductase family protein, partial [Phycisphaerales bacterium]|nr:flavin reductase family protein [Phycisphaerales bacterium]
MALDNPTAEAVQDVLKRFPKGGFLLTASHGLSRNGMLVNRVQQASNVPPTLLISVPKGQPLSPLIRDRRAFALCELAQGDLLLNRLFEHPRELHGDDPFLGLPVIETTLGLPVPRCVSSWV